MNSIAVIGDADTVLAFALGGVAGYVVGSADDACAVVDRAVESVHRAGGPVRQPCVLLITSGTADMIRPHLDALTLDVRAPLILEFPGFHDPLSPGPVERFVERVLGAHL